MRKNKGITLVSLVVTIIVLIILAGVSINLTLGKNGIITKAKQAKENIELAKIEEETTLNELYTQIEAEGGTIGEVSYDAIAKLNEFKMSIADAIEEAGGVKPEYTANSTTFGDSIKGIVKEVTKDATATAEDIANGKTAYANGTKIIGTAKLIEGNGIKLYASSQYGNYSKKSNENMILLASDNLGAIYDDGISLSNNIITFNRNMKVNIIIKFYSYVDNKGKVTVDYHLGGNTTNIVSNLGTIASTTNGMKGSYVLLEDVNISSGDIFYLTITTSGSGRYGLDVIIF